MGCVYLVQGPNGYYIGKTVKSLDHRRKQHLAAAARGEAWAFYRALRKHPAGWAWSVLCESDDNALLCAKEIEAIARYRRDGVRLYNSTDGGQGTTGRCLSAETRAKIAEKAKGRPSGNKGKRSPNRGGKLPAETKDKMAEAKRRYWQQRREAGLSLRHGVVTEAGRAALSANATERWNERRATGMKTIGK